MDAPAAHDGAPDDPTAPPLAGDAFSDAAHGRRGHHTPVWFMRQAGRSLPEYRSVRGSGSILDAIKQPELAAEITMQPVRRYGVDAAVLYSDIVVAPHAVGFGITLAAVISPKDGMRVVMPKKFMIGSKRETG